MFSEGCKKAIESLDESKNGISAQSSLIAGDERSSRLGCSLVISEDSRAIQSRLVLTKVKQLPQLRPLSWGRKEENPTVPTMNKLLPLWQTPPLTVISWRFCSTCCTIASKSRASFSSLILFSSSFFSSFLILKKRDNVQWALVTLNTLGRKF